MQGNSGARPYGRVEDSRRLRGSMLVRQLENGQKSTLSEPGGSQDLQWTMSTRLGSIAGSAPCSISRADVDPLCCSRGTLGG